jgi:precorrin-6x reductase
MMATFALFQDFMDATSDVWKVVDDCRTAVEGAWSEPRRVFQQMGRGKVWMFSLW